MSVLRPWLVAPIVLLAACTPERAVGVDGAAPALAASLAKASSQKGSTTGTSSTSGPGGDSSTTDPHFVTAAADAPVIANPVVQFWAVRGQDRTGTMYYHRADGTGRDSIPLFSLRVRPNSALRA
jgi:hypothetical protein